MTVKADLSIAIGEITTAKADPRTVALDAATNNRKDERIFLRADKAASYGDLMDIMNVLRDAGYLKIALVGLEAAPAKP